MQYREFGKTGLKISALGFGAMRLPYDQKNGKTIYDVDQGIQIIRRALELGVNYVDTAPDYCDGESEIIVGQAIKGWRDKILLSTKNSIDDSSGSHWRERLEKSLRRLDESVIDFYHMWGIGRKTYDKSINVPDGPLEAAFQAKSEGLIRHLSFSFHDQPENMIYLADTGYFESVLCQYNLLDRANETAIAHARSRGLGVVIMGPVAGGRLGAPSAEIQSLLPGKVSSSAELALRFVLANPDVSCALSGMGSLAMVEENARVASDESPLTPGERAGIEASLAEMQKMAELYCTGCKYCMPCPNGVNIPLNFELMNARRVYGLTDYARRRYREIGQNDWTPGKKADACTECGLCEAKCPQSIAIRRQLKDTAAVLG
jgi:predicted aldo/keto reductase-like oxidoreductase